MTVSPTLRRAAFGLAASAFVMLPVADVVTTAHAQEGAQSALKQNAADRRAADARAAAADARAAAADARGAAAEARGTAADRDIAKARAEQATIASAKACLTEIIKVEPARVQGMSVDQAIKNACAIRDEIQSSRRLKKADVTNG